MNITSSLKSNINNIKSQFNNSKDIIIKQFTSGNYNIGIVYLKGMVDVMQLSQFVIQPLQLADTSKIDDLEQLMGNIVVYPETAEETDFCKIISEITKGKVAIIVDKYKTIYLIELDKPKERGLTEPPTSAVLKGPREGFNENIKTNIAVVRKILSTSDLVAEMLTVGRVTTTSVCVMYLKGIAEKTLVKEIINRLKTIDIDGIIDSYYITEFLKPHKESMFKQLGNTEKPDVACAKMLEGRILILVDGSPIAITLPYVIFEDFQAADDYYKISANATFVRMLRIISCFITILLPGLYIAMQLYHYKAIPLKFLITITNSTQGLPLTPVTEILFVLILFEILYEASLRMPQYLGIALSVVGALILGDTAVKAGLISPPAVMIVALSGITLYTIPDQSQQLSILRLMFTLAGSMLGFYGLIILSIFVIMYLNDYDNFRAPYLSPFSPYVKNDIKDALIKQPLLEMKTRPLSYPNKNLRRMKNDKKG